jgi:two-component system response regulator AtoC
LQEHDKAMILLVDDQDSIRFFLEKTLTEEGFDARSAATGREALEIVRHEIPDLVLLDLKLPDLNGLDVLRQIKESLPEMVVIMITAFGDIQVAVEAMKNGAFDFVNKPINLEQLLLVIDKGLRSKKVDRELLRLRRKYKDLLGSEHVPSESEQMQKVYEVIQQVARSETTTVLIEGESGSGKEVIANLIHKFSPRSDRPFLEINCASLPEELLESELFGHEKGAFTDAKVQKPGLLELANRGTLFLDEIGEMSLTIQVKLLRVLERMSFRRVGGTKDINVSVRIISATNRDLKEAVGVGTFREDLYYRLKVVPIYVPPLRERRSDVLPLIHHFIGLYNRQFNKSFEGLGAEAREIVLTYEWPGNIRELKNMVERIVLLEEGPLIEAEHLPMTQPETGRSSSYLARLERVLSLPIPEDGIPFEDLIAELERELILKASKESGWNQSRSAALLRMKRDKLRYRMKNYDLGPAPVTR